MSNIITALGSAIYSVLSAGTVPVYHTRAPQGAKPPYAVFAAENHGVNEYTFTSESISADYSVKAVSKALWPKEAAEVWEYLDSLMQDANLSVSGWQNLRCRRASVFLYPDDERFWHAGGIYRIDLHKS